MATAEKESEQRQPDEQYQGKEKANNNEGLEKQHGEKSTATPHL